MAKIDIQNWVTDTRRLTRLIMVIGVLLVVTVIAFGGYYYYDRYHSSKPSTLQTNLVQAEQAVAQDPTNAEKRAALAELYMFNARYDDAIAKAGEVMVAAPDNQRAWLVLGMSYAFKGDAPSSIEPLQKYVDANKDVDMPGLNRGLQAAAYYLGDSYLKLGQAEKAVEPLTNAVQWSKTDADAMYKLGVAWTKTNKYDDALLMFHSAVAFVPNFSEAYEGMAEVYQIKNQPGYVKYAQGMVAYSKKDYPAAIDLLTQSTQAEPEFAPAFAGLGLAHEAQGSWEQALSAYTTAAKLDVNNLTASHGLDRVNKLLNK